MELRFSESEITYWTDQYLIHQRDEEALREQQLVELIDIIQDRGHLIKEELYKIAYWKSPRRSKLVYDNSEESVIEITTSAFSSKDNDDKLNELTKLSGIGEPIASAILHFYDEGMYPILDIHALWASGLEWISRTTYPFWVEYVEFCRDLAVRNSVDMRTVDRALWRFSYDHPDKESVENLSNSIVNNWTDRRSKLEELKGGGSFSPELKAYIIGVTDKLCSLGMSLEECANILGMWSGTIIRWKNDRDE
ncbi:hypothetical protein JT359_13680 [Candidatus Poribacteria bacterium]|nr:hypothetical protein [Candidatus Poribacteria bacterium]